MARIMPEFMILANEFFKIITKHYKNRGKKEKKFTQKE